MPSNQFQILLFLLFIFQLVKTKSVSKENISIPLSNILSFANYGSNRTSQNPFIDATSLKILISDLQIRRRTNKTKTFKNITVQCYNEREIIKWYSNSANGLTKDQFMNVCPTLLLQVASKVCRRSEVANIPEKNNLKIWIFSFGAVIVCSLVGLLVVWLIPLMPKSYYNSISQLLIALAVGSLTGDALLHLIPHALLDDNKGGHSHGGGSSHSTMVYKSLVALIGIHLFFLTERITILWQNLRSKRKFKNKQVSQENYYSEVSANDKFDDSEKPTKSAEKKIVPTNKLQWASKSRKYSGSSKELDNNGSHNKLDGEANIASHLCNRPKSKPHVNSDCPDSMNYDLCNTINPYSMNRESNGSNSKNFDIKLQTNGEIKTNNNLQSNEENKIIFPGTDQLSTPNNNVHLLSTPNDNSNWSNKDDYKLLQQTPIEGNVKIIEIKNVGSKHVYEEDQGEIGAGGATVIKSLAPHPFQNKPHGHHHGHSHDLSSVKAIAYTVIAGDGLHNFCDGIAIGAAFANNISGGFSTAIAVLCHELPHELGDFVVLLHAGMSLRTAIFYNLMSSIFCTIGMIIGVQLGKLPSLSSWIFMLTAGMFLYIALVDMMPELSTRRLKGKKIFHRPSILFLWQNIGLLLGSVNMLVIALYEDKMF